jgi:hypothetical protein
MLSLHERGMTLYLKKRVYYCLLGLRGENVLRGLLLPDAAEQQGHAVSGRALFQSHGSVCSNDEAGQPASRSSVVLEGSLLLADGSGGAHLYHGLGSLDRYMNLGPIKLNGLILKLIAAVIILLKIAFFPY